MNYLDKIPFLFALFEQSRRLPDIRIEPHADPQAPVFESFQIRRCIREIVLVKFQVTPLIGLHPEGVKMEDAQGNVAVSESVQKASDCFFIVVCRETC